MGTVARIIKKINLPDGGVNVFISTLKRFRVRKTVNERAPMIAIVDYLDDEESDTFEVKALTRALIGEIQPVFVDQHGLVLEPLRPGLLGNVLVDALAQLARIGRAVEPFGLAAELHALHHSCHGGLGPESYRRFRKIFEPRFQL